MVKKPPKPTPAMAGKQPRKSLSFTLRLDPELRAEAEAAARADSRSLASWIKLAMRAALQRKPRSRT